MDRQEKWDRRFVELSKFIAQWSLDPSTKVGAVITDTNRRVISVGYNGLAQGVEDLPERLNTRELKYKMTVHAEMNAILFANSSLKGASLATWPFMPCACCASSVIQAGIKRVVAPWNDNPRWIAEFELSKQMFKEAGVKVCLLDIPEV